MRMKLKVTRPDGTEEEIEVSAYEALDVNVEPIEAAIESEFIPLVEKAVKRDGQAEIKIIQPGWGSSGHYSREMLERDGPKVFKKGLKMFWDHATASEEAERPEGSLNRLAGELTSAARWQENGAQGPGLYAHAKIFEGFQSAVDQLAPHIGVSIRALGQAKQGEAEGRRGPLIEKLVAARSVDFVTEPGAGGAIVQLFESARSGPREDAPMELTEAKVQEMIAAATTPLQESLTATQAKLSTAETDNARLREGLLMRDARDYVVGALNATNFLESTKVRLIERLAATPPVKDNALDRDAFKTLVEDAIKDERTYLAQYSGSPVRGMGTHEVKESTAEEIQARLNESFKAFGLSEEAAKTAAAGR